jgi:hypothetical protein
MFWTYVVRGVEVEEDFGMDGARSHAVWCGGRKEGLVDRCL